MLSGIALKLAGAAAVVATIAVMAWRIERLAHQRDTARAELIAAVEANGTLIHERDRYRADAARVQAQAHKLTTDLRALQSAAATFQENLSDAARACPLLDSDRRAVLCLLYPGAEGCHPNGARPSR